MKKIKGNTILNICSMLYVTNEYGENEELIEDEVISLEGFLDYNGGTTNKSMDAKLEDCTYVFIADFIEDLEKLDEYNLENLIGKIDDDRYEIGKIDNVMNLNKHLEIYLRKVGSKDD